MKKISFGSSLLLFLAACIWGVAFVAQSVGMDYMGPCTFNGIRFLIGGTVLLPLVYVRVKKKKNTPEELPPALTLKGGICCGLAICAASLCQQIGIMETTVGKAGFITTLYIIIVPVFGLFLRKKVPGKVWIAAAVAAVGMYMLCINESFSVSRGDAFVFLCAIIFAVHILVIDYFSPKTDGVALSCIQFYTAGIICTAAAFAVETPTWGQFVSGIVPILYARFHIHTQFIQHRKIFISMIGNFRFLYLYRINFVQWRKLTYYRHDLQQCIFYHVTGIFTDC